MAFPVRLSLSCSICLLVLFLYFRFFFSFLSLLLYLSTVCICCCLLAFNLGHEQRPATTKTDIPSSSSSSSSPSSSSFSSSPPSGKLTYDVFLSFRGEDTRKNFTDHLYSALTNKGIITFKDDEELERGESIAPSLLKAIEESRYAVVVLSRNYANSSWCLDEIAKIVECMKSMGQTVLPVFYDVDPSEVRHQTGKHFRKAFEKHQKRFEGNPDSKVQRWKNALSQVASLSGWHLQDRYESKVIQDIVQKIFIDLNQKISTSMDGYVGMDSHLNKMLSYLDIGCPDVVRIIGICGMGGIGKTTIAQVVSEMVRPQFEGYSFLQNVREVTEKQGALHLQQKLLSDLLAINVNVQNTKMGQDIIGYRLCTKRVLIILDDVDQDEQLEALCHRDWFGPGSRIIITSRNEHLLSAVDTDEVYNVNPLIDAEALQLFRMKAFKKDQLVGEEFLKLPEEFHKLSKEFLKYADGLPLAIKVLGSSVKGRSVELWSSALDRLKEYPEKKIINVLKVSFDGLEPREQKIFLDIACFFKGENKDRVRRILQGSDAHCPDFDLQVLLDKSMITLFGSKLWMHDLIQELGWEIVRQECCDEPGKRSRLWLLNEIIDVLDQNKATSAVQSILLQGPKEDVVHSVNDSFSNMDKLRLLKIWNVKFSGNIKYLSNKLQFLQWHECPLDSFPPDFQPDNLVELHMHSSRIKQLWKGEKGWRMLRLIDMTGSLYLISTPDFTEVPFLEILVLKRCMSLVEVHPSLGLLKKLKSLNMSECIFVESMPPFTCLEALETLNLSLCLSLKKFPEIKGNMKRLLEIRLDGTSIKQLPPSVERFTGLTTLNLILCQKLLHFPSSIQCLTSLKSLDLTGCSKLDEIPENLNCMESLEKLHIGGTAIRDTSFLEGMKNLKSLSCQGCKGDAPRSLLSPGSLSSLTSLIQLDLSNCNLMDEDIPDDLSSLISLTMLNLSGNSFVRLPESFSQLSKLGTLYLRNCRRLELVPKKLPLSLEYVYAQDCTSLTDYPNQIKVLTSEESRLTTLNSLLDSSSLGDLDSFTTLIYETNGLNSLELLMIHDHKEEKRVEFVSLPSPEHLNYITPLSIPFTSAHVLWENEIPEWFSTTSTSNPISIPTDDNKWNGVATCALFLVNTAAHPEYSNYSYHINLETDVVGPKPVVIDWQVDVRLFRSKSHLLFISYEPSWKFPEWGLNVSTVVRARFETNNPYMVVQKCGIRLVYEQDAGWFSNLWPENDSICLTIDEEAAQESSWFSQDEVHKYLKWEKFIPPLEAASALLLRKNIESVLPRYLEALNHRSARYKFNISGCPAWLTRSHPIEIPQNLHKSKKWMGFAIYASIAEEAGHIIREGEDNYRVYFQLSTGRKSHKTLSQELKHVRSPHHQLLVVYIPRAQIPEALFTETSTTEMHIGCFACSPYVKFQRRGGRIVYQDDVQVLVDTIIQCMQREDSLEFYHKMVVEDWIELIGFQGGHLEGIYTPKERDPRTRWEQKFELFSQKYRNLDWSTPCRVLCLFWGAEISKWKWLMHFKRGNRAEIQLPLYLFDDPNWLGIAVCVFNRSSPEDPNMSFGNSSASPDSEYNALTCRMESDVDWAGLHDLKLQARVRKIKPLEFAFVFDSTWFAFIPRSGGCFSKHWRISKCKVAKATILSSSPCLAVQSCALGLVYKADVEHLVYTLTSCELP